MMKAEIDVFQFLLNFRRSFKSLQQLTWQVIATEKRYPLENLTQEQMLSQIKMYIFLIGEIKEIYKELKEAKEEYELTK